MSRRRRPDAHARERARREAGEHRRAALPQPTGGPGHRVPSLGPDSVLFVAADLTDTDDGTWRVELHPTALGTAETGPVHPAPPALRDDVVTNTFPDLISARDGVLRLVDELADQVGLTVGTLWHYHGDQSRWADLVAQHNLTEGLPPDVVVGFAADLGDSHSPPAAHP